MADFITEYQEVELEAIAAGKPEGVSEEAFRAHAGLTARIVGKEIERVSATRRKELGLGAPIEKIERIMTDERLDDYDKGADDDLDKFNERRLSVLKTAVSTLGTLAVGAATGGIGSIGTIASISLAAGRLLMLLRGEDAPADTDPNYEPPKEPQPQPES